MNNHDSKSLASSAKSDRKIVEKNRRNQMKLLCSQLSSLVSRHQLATGEAKTTLQDQIEEATNYIKKLQENIQKSKQKRDSLLGFDGSNISETSNSQKRLMLKLNSPVQIEVNENGEILEVTLVTGMECQFIFTEAIRILHEENADVFNASYSAVGGCVFHTIHAKIEEATSNYGVARITERLKKFAL